MKKMYQAMGVAVVLLELVLTTGCTNPNGTPNNTGTGALMGGALGTLAGGLAGGRHAGRDALIGGLAGVVVGGLVGHMIDQDQQRRWQEQSPQRCKPFSITMRSISNNNKRPNRSHRDRPRKRRHRLRCDEALTPLTVDDIKALDSAGVKKDVIIAEIQRSKSVYTQADITALQHPIPTLIRPSSSA